jgi:nitrogen fixation NifU-like protein
MKKNDLTFKQNLILSHYEEPKFKVAKIKNSSAFRVGKKDSPSCIDNIVAYAKIKKNVIEEIKFSGIGCVICTASTDLMCTYINKKTTAEAKKIISNYLNMIDNKKYDKTLLGDLVVFDNVNKQMNRIKCAKTGIEAIYESIK